MTLTDFQIQVHSTAVEKGWWDKGDRNYGEICALYHSEISEAYEELLNDDVDVYYNEENPRKPEGCLVELGDFVIRALDWCGYNEITIENLFNIYYNEVELMDHKIIGDLHKLISDSFEMYRKGEDKYEYVKPIAKAIVLTFKYAYEIDIEMMVILILKALYNNTRGYRHGNKIA